MIDLAIAVRLLMNFKKLIQSIQQTHSVLQESVNKAINRSLTIRNWLIGFYIAEFEQKGEDRATYGSKLIGLLAQKLKNKSLSEGNLKVFRQFYNTYPQIGQVMTDQLNQIAAQIGQSPIGQLQNNDFHLINSINESLAEYTKNSLSGGNILSNQGDLPSPISPSLLINNLQVLPEKLISKLSFTHLVQLLPINDPLKRSFYEIECIKGGWSVSELKRQINSLYFERSGLSQHPEKLSALIAEKTERMQPADIIKSVYSFEFLGLQAKSVVEENDLEAALLDNLQEFMLELGHGFCLEARQKRILIGDEHYFIDLVFYHRILKCHVLIDLKIEEFTHVNAGQLNTYLNYYKAEVQQPTDNPPVGILLVTNKNETLAEYATAGMDQRLFVSKYLVKLPGKKQLENFIGNQLRQL